jgi:hypothetical protein
MPVGPLTVPVPVSLGYTADAQRVKLDPALAGGVQTEWDLESMASVVTWLESTRDYVARMVTGMNSIMDVLGESQSTPLGGFPAAQTMYAQHQGVWQGVQGSLKQTHAQLDAAVAGTKKVIENYRTAEELNRAKPAAVESAMSGTAGSSGSDASAGSASPVTSSATSVSPTDSGTSASSGAADSAGGGGSW